VGTTYNVTTAALTANVATLGVVTAAGLRAGYSVHVDGLGAPYDGQHTLTAVDATLNEVTFAKNHANTAEADVWGQLNIHVTWIDSTDVVDFLGMAPTEEIDADYLEFATDAANVWCFDRRQSAGYTDVPSVAPSARAKLGAVMKAGELYRQRGSVEAFASFQQFEGVAPIASNVEILRLLGINKPGIA
jgi:hypothetical protein